MGSRIAVSGLRVSGLEVQRVVRGFTYKVCCFKLLVRLFFGILQGTSRGENAPQAIPSKAKFARVQHAYHSCGISQHNVGP